MKQPSGFISKGNETKVCKLMKSLYGLKQAARSWNAKLHQELIRQGFERCKSDPCLYRKCSHGSWCYVLVYVDDLIVASKSIQMLEEVPISLRKSFEISEMGEIHHYLGMEVEKNEDGDYFLSQRRYINDIIILSGLNEAKESNIPLDPGYVTKENEGEVLPDNRNYQKFIGKLLYVAINTRPDIATAVSILSRNTSRPNQEDWIELKRVIRYLKGTNNYRLRLSKLTEPEGIVGYSDADWAENRRDRKSNSGYVFKINGGTVSWACRKQTCVSLSTAEAEFIALSESVQEALWLKQLLRELNGNPEKLVIFEDNQSCLKIVETEKFSSRTKHIATKIHFVRDQIKKGNITCVYCPSETMAADILTKPLPRIRTAKLAELIGLTSVV